MEKTLVATLDDSLEHYVGKSIPKGDPCCEHIIRRGVKSSLDVGHDLSSDQ
jgi:hypothetical protein